MSVRTTHYVLYGVKLPFDALTYEQVEDYLPGEPEAERTGVTVLYDGMRGRYIIIGIVLAEGEEAEGFPETVTFDPVPPGKWFDAVVEALLDLNVKTPGVSFHYIVVSHSR